MSDPTGIFSLRPELVDMIAFHLFSNDLFNLRLSFSDLLRATSVSVPNG